MTVMEQRNRFLFFLLIGLAALTVGYYAFSVYSENKSVENVFVLDDYSGIDRVTLQSQRDTVSLRFDGARWNVNQELADRNLIDVLFATLQQAKPVRPIAKVLQDSVSRVLTNTGVKVSLYNEGEENPALVFYAGGDTRKSQTYFMHSDDPAVYLVTIPGYRVYVSGIFELDALGWKDKHVYQLNWRNFDSFSASFRNSEQNFNVRFIDSHFTIEGMAGVDTTRLNDYLDAISYLTVAGYSSSDTVLDSLVKESPEITLTARDVSGKEYSLTLYSAPPAANRVAGVINGRQLAYFDPQQVAPVRHGKSYFKTGN